MSDCSAQLAQLTSTLQSLAGKVEAISQTLGGTFVETFLEQVKQGIGEHIKTSLHQEAPKILSTVTEGLKLGLGRETAKIVAAVTTGAETALPEAVGKMTQTVTQTVAQTVAQNVAPAVATAAGLAAALGNHQEPPPSRPPEDPVKLKKDLDLNNLKYLLSKAGVKDAGSYASFAQNLVESKDFQKLSAQKNRLSIVGGFLGALVWPINPIYFLLLPLNAVLFFCLWLYVLTSDITDTGALSKVLFVVDTSGRNDAITKGFRIAWWVYLVGVPVNWALMTALIWLGWTGGEFAVDHPELVMQGMAFLA